MYLLTYHYLKVSWGKCAVSLLLRSWLATGGVSGVRNWSLLDGVVEGISACFSKS